MPSAEEFTLLCQPTRCRSGVELELRKTASIKRQIPYWEFQGTSEPDAATTVAITKMALDAFNSEVEGERKLLANLGECCTDPNLQRQIHECRQTMQLRSDEFVESILKGAKSKTSIIKCSDEDVISLVIESMHTMSLDFSLEIQRRALSSEVVEKLEKLFKDIVEEKIKNKDIDLNNRAIHLIVDCIDFNCLQLVAFKDDQQRVARTIESLVSLFNLLEVQSRC